MRGGQMTDYGNAPDGRNESAPHSPGARAGRGKCHLEKGLDSKRIDKVLSLLVSVGGFHSKGNNSSEYWWFKITFSMCIMASFFGLAADSLSDPDLPGVGLDEIFRCRGSLRPLP